MKRIFIEDERHSEPYREFDTVHDAIAELRRFAVIPWDQDPNVAPCTGWRKCGRTYEIVEFDDSSRPWKEISRIPALEISASGVSWSDGLQYYDTEAIPV